MSDLRRVLLVTEPGKDGVFVIVRGLVRYLHAKYPGITVDLAYSSRRELGGATELAAEVRARGGEAIDLEVSNSPEPGDLRALWRMLSLVRRRRPQVIHAHSSKAGALVRVLAVLPGFPPVIYTPHAYYGVARLGGRKEKFFNAIEAVLGHIGTTACCSSDEQSFAISVLKLPSSRVVTILNGIDTAKFHSTTESEKRSLREQLGLLADRRLLVTVGRDTPQKNYPPLYSALAQVLGAHPDMHFAHAGEGSVELCASLPEPARSRATAFNQLSSPQMLLGAADGFILVSRYEGFSLSMLEALSCGVPVILTDVVGLGAIRELGFKWGHWLPAPEEGPGFVDAIGKGIEEWLAGERGPIIAQRKLACELMDLGVNFEKMISLYRSRL